MRNLKLKPETSGIARVLRWASETAWLSAARLFTGAILSLGKLAGVMLGGIGVTALIGNLLICGALLLLGPTFVINLFVG